MKELFVYCCLVLGIQTIGFGQEKVWKNTEEILAEVDALKQQIVQPIFADRDFKITAYGAVGDGQTKNTEALKKQLKAARLPVGVGYWCRRVSF